MIKDNVSVPSLDGMSCLVTISQCVFHRFTHKEKLLVDICDCSIYQHIQIEGTNMPNQYFKIGSFTQRIDDKTIVAVKFSDSTSYLFESASNQQCVFAVSFDNQDQNLKHFQNVLTQATHLVLQNEQKYSMTTIKNKIQAHCPQLTEEIIQTNNTISTVGKIVGGILGSVSKLTVQPTAKAQVMMNIGFQEVAKKTLSDQNRGKWSVLKQKASNLNEMMTGYYKPIDNKFKQLSSMIGTAFQTSENKYVKTIKNFGRETARVLNKNYLKAEKTEPSAVVIQKATDVANFEPEESINQINTN